MITTVLAAVLFLKSSPQTGLHWPMIAGSHILVNGIDDSGSALLEHVKILEKEGLKASVLKVGGKGTWAKLTVPAKAAHWQTLQFAFTFLRDGTVASFGGLQLLTRDGSLWFGKRGAESRIAPINGSDLTDVELVSSGDAVSLTLNGVKSGKPVATKKPLIPFEIGVDPFKGNVIGIAAWGRELTTDELFANHSAMQEKAKALFADTPRVTIEGETTAVTPVPDVERIRPYRSALIAEEYKIIRIASGRMSSLKPGMKIRVFRYGIKAGDKTAIKDAKVGDKAKMLIEPFDANPKWGREFQVNDLEPDITIPQFVDVTPAD